MIKKRYIIPAIALVGATAVAGNTALAYGMNGSGKNFNPQKREHRETMSQVIEKNDYASFQDIFSGTKMADIIDSQYKFDQLVIAHDLRQKDQFDEARDIMEEIGFIRGPTNGRFCQK